MTSDGARVDVDIRIDFEQLNRFSSEQITAIMLGVAKVLIAQQPRQKRLPYYPAQEERPKHEETEAESGVRR